MEPKFKPNDYVKWGESFTQSGKIIRRIYIPEAMTEPVYDIELDEWSQRLMAGSFNGRQAQVTESALAPKSSPL